MILERQLNVEGRFLGFKEQGLVLCQVVDAGAAEHRGHLGDGEHLETRLLKCSMMRAIAVVLPAHGPPVSTILVILSVILANGCYLKKFSQKESQRYTQSFTPTTFPS